MAKTTPKKKLTPTDIKKIKELLNVLRYSCEEGLDGTWDCSTAEGKEAFNTMADNCVDIASILGIELKPYAHKKEN